MRYKTLVSQMYTSYCPQDLPKMRKKLQLEKKKKIEIETHTVKIIDDPKVLLFNLFSSCTFNLNHSNLNEKNAKNL